MSSLDVSMSKLTKPSVQTPAGMRLRSRVAITGDRRQITHLANKGHLRGFDIAPDGKHIVFDRTRQNSDVVLIDLPKK